MSDCIFCKIIAGEIPSVKIWEDEDVFVFLDIHPLMKGHCLIIPKIHYENIFDIDEQVLQKITANAKYIAEKMKVNLGASGVNLLHASGKAAEQSVFHFHLHLVPRYENDSLHMNDRWLTKSQNPSLEDLQKVADEIKQQK